MTRKILQKNKGMILATVVVLAGISAILIASLTGWFSATLKTSRNLSDREQAFQIAEAGIEYYRWHLAHAQNDFQDGTGAAGPYVHDYFDKDGVKIGNFSLTITPPLLGSTKVKIVSVGEVENNPNAKRIIEAEYGIPSIAEFAVVSNDNLRFGAGTEVFGPIMSNGGIHFDGIAHNTVSSAKASYIDPDYPGASAQFGVYTRVNPPPAIGLNTDTTVSAEAPPQIPTQRADVFGAGRQFPVPAIDFTGLTTNLASLQTAAQADGQYFAASGEKGYDVVFKTDNTFDVYKVTSLSSLATTCSSTVSGFGSWSVGAETLLGNYAVPANGIIFFADNVWVRGTVNGTRATVVAAVLPDVVSTRKSITVNNDLMYTNTDGTDSIGLIAQKDINVGLVSEDDLVISAALIAVNGRIGRYYYQPVNGGNEGCGVNATRTKLTLNGMIASNLRYGFAYTDNTGYQTRVLNYDANFTYSAPPSFPVSSSGQYELISWKDISAN